MRFALVIAGIFLLIFLESCELGYFKDFSNPYPEVEVVSVSQTGNDTTILKVLIRSEGDANVQDIGGGYSLNGIEFPRDYPLQREASSILGDTFSVPFYNLEIGQTYYFRGFATNDFGYSFSDTVAFQIPEPIAYEVPCELEENTLYYNDKIFRKNYAINAGSRTSIDVAFGPFGVRGSAFLYFTFPEIPNSGIYKTVYEYEPSEDGTVGLRLQKNELLSTIHFPVQGSEVYVEKDSTGKYTVSFCELKFPNLELDNEFVSVSFTTD